MNRSKNSKRSPARRDLALTCLMALVAFSISSYFDGFERFSHWSRTHDTWEVDELATMLVALTFAFAFFAWRRWREFQRETVRRQMAERQLRESEESYKRVVARVTEVSSSVNPSQSKSRTTQPGSKARRDAILLFISAVLGWIIAARIDAFEKFSAWSAYNARQLNEVVIVLTIVAFALVIYSWRRSREIKKERASREEVENALRKGEERYRQIVDHATDVIYRTDLLGKFTYCNPAVFEIMKYSQAELLGRHYLELIRPDCREDIETFYKQQMLDHVSTTYREFHAIRKDGVEILIGQNVQLLTENGRVAGFQAVARDITRQRKEEESLRQMKEYRNLFQLASDPILILDAVDGRVLDVNDKACKTYGLTREEFGRRHLTDLAANPEAARKRLEQLRSEEKLQPYETSHLRADGTPLHFIISPTVIEYQSHKAILSINRDVTEQRRIEEERQQLEQQLRQSQKLESIGQLAGGIAHDFNNLLTAINGYSELTLQRLDPDSPARATLEQIKKAGLRAASLTSQLLAFSRKQVLQPKILDLNSIVSNVDNMLRRLIGEDIDLITLLKPDLGQIKADPGQVEQVIMNLAVNARDAMPQGGKITIETGHTYLDEAYASKHLSVRPGEYIMLMLSDTGTGMDAATQKQIFDPFFTTKEVGKGTGLGLSTVYGIVKQSGGNIWVYSEVGKGTTFKVYFPRYDQAPTRETTAEVSVPRGHETVLLVEDEEIVRELSRHILEANGYRVLSAANGEDGLRTFKEFQGNIDLLITDVVMPEMSGRELATNISRLKPETRILFMSGYTDDAIVRHGILEERMSFIQKPFSPDSLALKTRELLDHVS